MKKLISCVLALVLALSLVPSALAAEGASVDKFTDVPADAWYRDELAYALHNGYISGTSETTFAPDALVTRGQFVTILGRMVNADVSQFKTTQFKDVNITSWYGPYVEWARSTGIVNGISSTQFAPTNNITVEQMGVMVSNCISKPSMSPKAAPVVYSDMSSVSTWAVSGVEAMAKYNLLPVDAASNINPHKQATRSECTVSLVRLAKAMGLGEAPIVTDKPYVPKIPTAGQSVSFVNQPVLAGKVTSYSDLIPGNPQLITNFAPDDYASFESTALYMLKNGLSQVKLDCSDVGSLDLINKFVHKYEGICTSCSVVEVGGVKTLNVAVAGLEDGSCPALAVAVKVHDEMWASGQIVASMTQKQKARVYYDWLVKHCEYDQEYADANSVLGIGWDEFFQLITKDVNDIEMFEPAHFALIDGKAVCWGYTDAYNLLLRLEGIECDVAVSNAGNHEWSTAVLDGTLYHIDATWGDQHNVPADKYFCMTEEAAWARFGGFKKELEFRQMMDGLFVQ